MKRFERQQGLDPNPLHPWAFFLRATLFHLFLLTLLRLIFAVIFHRQLNAPFSSVLYAFFLGLKFDFRLLLILLIPTFLHFLLAPGSLSRRGARSFWSWTVALLWTLILSFYFLDFGHFAYLHSRVSGAVIKFLENPLISAQMVWQSYPVVWCALILVAFFIAMALVLKKWIYRPLTPPMNKRSRALQGISLFLFFAAGLYGKWGAYPLRWSDAYFGPHAGLTQLSLNPLMYFAETYNFRSIDFDEKKTREFYQDLVPFLGIENADREKLNFLREVKPVGKIAGRPNIVIVVLESMAAFKSGLFACELNATPALDGLAKESLFFRQFYVPTIATARSLFATVTGLPDVTLVKSSSRNPLVVEQNVPMNQLKEYEKFYFLGGSSSWGNVRGLFSYNVDGVHIMDDSVLSGKRTDVWGLSDLQLFKEANRVLKEKKGPFLAVIQSAGYHRPYTIPEERDKFELINLPQNKLQDCDFADNEEYNSLRFQDYALGEFFRLAKSEAYYDNTLFFIYGDHGLLVSSAKNINEGQRILSLENYHVPFLIHGPKFMAAGENNTIASQLDLWPTIMGLIGQSYRYRGPGRDLFDPRFDQSRGAFTFGWFENPPQLGFFDQEFYFFKNTNGKESLHRYQASDALTDVSAQYPERFDKLRRQALGVYEMSRYLLYHNPRVP